MAAIPSSSFTPLETFLGGILLHLATSTLLEDTGLVLGVSGILSGAIWPIPLPFHRSRRATTTERTLHPRTPAPGRNSNGKTSKHGESKRRSEPNGATGTGTAGAANETRRDVGSIGERQWRWAVLGGMYAAPITAGFILSRVPGRGLGVYPGDAMAAWEALGGSWGRVGTAGFLVGLGSRLGSGCTSGHMLCGVSRLSPRSIIATSIFLPVASLTTFLFPLPVLPAASGSAGAIASSTSTSTGTSISLSSLLSLSSLYTLPHLLLPIAAMLLLRTYLRRELSRPVTPDGPPPAIDRIWAYVLCGWAFGMGLLVSGMADPAKVHAFLRVWDPPSWDPSMLLVILGGLVPNMIHYQGLINRFGRSARTASAPAAASAPSSVNGVVAIPATTPRPRYAWATWSVPARGARPVDWRLIAGAAVFGVGWGLAGVCPGPAVVAWGQSSWAREQAPVGVKAAVILFVGAMLGGMGGARVLGSG